MKKLFFILIVALSCGLMSCNKTCSCTETLTITYGDEWGEEPEVSTANFTKEAKKCEDLNADATTNTFGVSQRDVVVCK